MRRRTSAVTISGKSEPESDRDKRGEIQSDGRGVPITGDIEEVNTETAGNQYHPRRSLFNPREYASTMFPVGRFDRLIVASGGVFAGLIGIAIGEVSNTFLTVRKRVPIKLSTGTSALILHLLERCSHPWSSSADSSDRC